MPKFWKTPQFEELKLEWDDKLKESGFDDIEKKAGDDLILKSLPSETQKRTLKNKETREAKIEYYNILFQKAFSENDYKDDSDKLIMERTAEGKSVKEISEELKSKKKIKHHKCTICYIRRRYETKWGIRIWKPEQMISRRVPKRASR